MLWMSAYLFSARTLIENHCPRHLRLKESALGRINDPMKQALQTDGML
jgi:hypothetical protein